MDVDPADHVVGIDDDGGGHRDGGGAIGVDSGEVEAEVELGGPGLRRWLR